MARKLDARQSISRDLLDQLTLATSHAASVVNEKPVDSTEVDNLLRSLNSEVTPPVRLRANDPATLVINLDSALVVNPEKNKNRMLSPIDGTAGKDLNDIFTGGTITFGANLANAVTVSVGTGLADLTALSIGGAGFGSVGVFLDDQGNIVLSTSLNGVASAADLPFPATLPGLAFIGMIEVEFDGLDNIVAFDDSKLFQFSDISTSNALSSQDRNLKLIAGGTWTWDLATTTLNLNADAYIQVPGLDDTSNTIALGNIVLAANEVAYVELNRTTNAVTVLPVLTSNINALAPTSNTVIIARRDGNDVIIGTHSFRLRDGQYLELDGALQEIRRLHDQLKIVPSAVAAVDEVDILGADITQLDLVNGTQTTLVQELDDTVIDFNGATINFTTGVISGGPLGTNFVPAVIPVGEYHWYSISLEGSGQDAVNRTTVTVEVGVALASNAVQATAPYADFEGSKKLGQVQVQNIGGVITVVDIRRLGAGSGSGGGGMCIEDLIDKDLDVENGFTCTNFYADVALGTTVTLESNSHFVSIDPTINGTLIIEPGSVFQTIDVDQDEYETKVVSAAYTAESWDELLVDTSGAGFTIDLPFSPVHGTRVKIKDREQTFDSNNLLLATTDGSTIDGSASPYTFDKVGAWAECVFDAADNDWKLFQSLPGSFTVVTANANYIAKDLEDVICDSSGGGFTVTLPDSPSEGTRVRVKDSEATFDTNPVFIATTDGSTIEDTASPFEIDVERAWAEFVYVSSTNNWEMFSPLVGDLDWRTGVITANYNAINDDELMCDTTGGSFTVSLPDGATIGDGVRVRVKDLADSFSANNLLIATVDGSTIEGTASPLTIDEDGAWAEFVWMSSTNDWRVFTPIIGGGWQTVVINDFDSPYATFDEQEIFADSSGGVITVDMPATPQLGDRVRLIDHDGSWSTNNITVNGNGNNIVGAATLTLNVDNAWVELVYNGVEWRVLNP